MSDDQSDELSVLAVNLRFYRAFNDGDVSAMNDVWAEQAPVACLHPGDTVLLGREAVMRRWQEILASRPGFTLRCDSPKVQLFGTTAIVCCYEGGNEHPAHLAATNVFVREERGWRMVHHHAGPLAAPIPVPRPSVLN
jgi:ketosteroid isomerase-like protein